MNGISNGDGTYRQLSNSDALVGMASNLPYPDYPITNNINQIKNEALEIYSFNIGTVSITSSSRVFTKTIDLPYRPSRYIAFKTSNGVASNYNDQLQMSSVTLNADASATVKFYGDVDNYQDVTIAFVMKR